MANVVTNNRVILPVPPPLVAPTRGSGLKTYGFTQVPWTGGAPPNAPKGKCMAPLMHASLWPSDSYKDAVKIKEACQTPIDMTKQLGILDHKKVQNISLTK